MQFGNPYNDAAIIAGGMSLVPDLRQQLMQDAELRMRQEVAALNRQKIEAAMEAARQSQEDEERYIAEAATVFQNPTSDAIRSFQARYPKYSEAIGKAWDGWQSDGRASDVTQISSILSNLRAGRPERAAQMARERYEADLKAGKADDQDREIIAALESNDPEQLRQVGGLLMMQLAAATDPEKVAANYQDLSQEFRQQDLHPSVVAKAESEAVKAAAEAKTAPAYYDARARREDAQADISESDARFRDRSNASIIAGRDARADRSRVLSGGGAPAAAAPRPVYVQYAKNAKGERIGYNRETKQWEPVR